MKYLEINTADLIPYARNARTHSEAQIEKIAKSIEDLNFKNWRFCVENDCYVVTDCGNVLRVCRRQKSKTGNLIEVYETMLLGGSLDRYGYKTYRIIEQGKKKHLKGHRMILNAFLGKNESMCVNHKDGKKTNNSLSNLEWVTVAQNNKHAIETGLLNPSLGGMKNIKIEKFDWVSIFIQVKELGAKRQDIANRLGVSRQTIDNIINKVKKFMGETCPA